MGWEFVEEVVGLLKPEPPTERERAAAEMVSASDYTIYAEKLSGICEESKEAFVRSGVSGMLLTGDLVVGIYTAGGDLVSAVCGTYVHAATGGPPMKYVLKRFKDSSVGVREGDFFYVTDALYGSLHSADQALFMPIFHNGELVAWANAAVQQTEVGATEPGLATNAKSRYDEGLKLPPVKVGENFQLRQDLVEALSNMCRTPEAMAIDIRARATACERIGVRMRELCAKKGNDFVLGLLSKMITEAERGARQRISRWYDGVYRFVSFYDTIGYREALVKATLQVIKEGDHLIMDFSEGTSPENDGSWNCFGHAAVAHVAMVLYEGVFAELPASSGVFAAIDFKFKKGSVLHASPSASTMCSPAFGATAMQATQITFSKMMFPIEEDRHLVSAHTSGSSGGYFFAGVNQWGRFVSDNMTIGLNTSGIGARATGDGVDAGCFSWCPWGKASDAEDVETEAPWLHLYYSYMKDSGGAGRYRGGGATTCALIPLHTPYVGFATLNNPSRVLFNVGLYGGYASPPLISLAVKNANVLEKLERGDGDLPRESIEMMTERTIKGDYEVSHGIRRMEPFKRGEIMMMVSGGAGGYGDILERAPEDVTKDLRNDRISAWSAQNLYKVVYDPETLEVDRKATEELRRAEREDRKKRGKPYAEFEKEWLAKDPPPSWVLDAYGSWPDGNPVKEVIRL